MSLHFDEDTEKLRWEEGWNITPPRDYGDLKWIFRNYTFYMFDLYCRRYLLDLQYETFLDFGSGPGNWLVYFAKRFGYHVTGIDYSSSACELARKNLEGAGVAGEVIEADFAEYKPEKQFDVVYLGGVIEHYKDPSEILKQAVGYLKPGGTLINRVPTSSGLNRMYVYLFDKEQLERMWPISSGMLDEWYKATGLVDVAADYIGSFALNMFPIHVVEETHPKWHDRLILPVGLVLNRVVNAVLISLHKYLCIKIECRWISPFVLALGKKKT